MKTPPWNTLLAFACALFLFQVVAHARLVAWYPLDEPAGDTGTAVAENIAGNDATTVGLDPDPNLSLVARGNPPAKQSLGCSYLLTKGGGLDLGADAAVQPTDKFTISFWFQPLTLDAFDRFVESAVGNGNDQDGMRIDMGVGDRFRVQLRDASGTNQQADHTTRISVGNWYFCAFRYDSAGVDNPPFQLTLVEFTGDPVDATAVTSATVGPANIGIGPLHFPHAMNTFIGLLNGQAAPGNALHGAIDEIAFYDNSDSNGVLTDQQLADVYNFGPSGVELVNSFESDVDSVAPGNPANLSWTVNEPFDALILDDGNGNTTDLAPMTANGTGTFEVTPSETTTYALRATRGDAANVFKVRILSGQAPDIGSFATSPNIIQTGGSADLSWAVTGADSLTLDPGATDVTALATTNVSPTETTTYTLTATNPFGMTTADVTVTVISGPVPAHRYVAATAGNTDGSWMDEVDTENWIMTGALRNDPLVTPSPNTNIAAAYSTGGGINGGSVGSFQFGEITAEVWLRVGVLGANHEVLFETGGGQNGISALITENEFRFLGSALDVRNLDITVPIGGLNLDDFVQLVFSNNAATDEFEVAVRDTFGSVRTASAMGDAVIGGNGAGLFVHASGALGVTDNNLGGRTELPDMTPAGLTGFAGEIGIVNIYDRILDENDIQAAFDAVATVVEQTPFEIKNVVYDDVLGTLELTWTSIDGNLYEGEFSTDLVDWFSLNDGVTATSSETTKAFNVPPGQDHFYIRVLDLGED